MKKVYVINLEPIEMGSRELIVGNKSNDEIRIFESYMEAEYHIYCMINSKERHKDAPEDCSKYLFQIRESYVKE